MPYNAPRHAELSDSESARTPSSAPSRKQLREMRLRADKLADVQSPTLIRCLGCGASIKLSVKSEYDASHWLRHRTRCVKKAKAREDERVAQPRSSASSTTGSSPASSERALTPHDEDDEGGLRLADPTAALRTDYPVFYDWQSWDWSQLKSRFLVSKHLI
ncbi:hypothetical protein B0H15DRAFT_836144 [Mycena belliarum]|uniref:Uncharacterized protein n=1 Tax=Mycena belliarum TaxID=1033014 RepID=A0AAD6U711_9AGAR|nr:hypothetical protein B0H15DRAFT_836144 [Mycena belliae]